MGQRRLYLPRRADDRARQPGCRVAARRRRRPDARVLPAKRGRDDRPWHGDRGGALAHARRPGWYGQLRGLHHGHRGLAAQLPDQRARLRRQGRWGGPSVDLWQRRCHRPCRQHRRHLPVAPRHQHCWRAASRVPGFRGLAAWHARPGPRRQWRGWCTSAVGAARQLRRQPERSPRGLWPGWQRLLRDGRQQRDHHAGRRCRRRQLPDRPALRLATHTGQRAGGRRLRAHRHHPRLCQQRRDRACGGPGRRWQRHLHGLFQQGRIAPGRRLRRRPIRHSRLRAGRDRRTRQHPDRRRRRGAPDHAVHARPDERAPRRGQRHGAIQHQCAGVGGRWRGLRQGGHPRHRVPRQLRHHRQGRVRRRRQCALPEHRSARDRRHGVRRRLLRPQHAGRRDHPHHRQPRQRHHQRRRRRGRTDRDEPARRLVEFDQPSADVARRAVRRAGHRRCRSDGGAGRLGRGDHHRVRRQHGGAGRRARCSLQRRCLQRQAGRCARGGHARVHHGFCSTLAARRREAGW